MRCKSQSELNASSILNTLRKRTQKCAGFIMQKNIISDKNEVN